MRRSDLKAAGMLFDALHGPAMGKVFPHLAGTLQGRDMSFSQLVALYEVSTRGPLTIADIANGVGISQNAGSRLVDGLVKAGMLARAENPADRRQKLVSITAAGGMFIPEMRAVTIEAFANLLARLPPELFERLVSIMREVAAHMPAMPKMPDVQ